VDGKAWANYQKNALERAEAAAKLEEDGAQACNLSEPGGMRPISDLLSLQEKIQKIEGEGDLLKSRNETLMAQNDLLKRELGEYKERFKAIEGVWFRRILRKVPALERARKRWNRKNP
jgi:hypothetical protein